MMHSQLSRLMALLAVVLTLGFLAGAADARVGGGSSMGSRGSRTFSAPAGTNTAPRTAPIQRSLTQPAQPGSVARASPSASQPGGLFNRSGLLGGLAAGFLGAGLLGLLFGHGLFGGLGGLASMMGLLLQLGLVALVGMLVWRWFQGRSQPALASAPMFRDLSTNPLRSGAVSAGLGMGSTAARVEITPADYDAFERLLGEIQAAYSAEDLNALRARVTPEMLSYFGEQLAANASRGVVNRISDVRLLQGDLSEAWREGDVEYATVAMRFSLIDRTIDRTTGQLVEGSEQPQEVTEVWTFMRAQRGNWLLSAIQQA